MPPAHLLLLCLVKAKENQYTDCHIHNAEEEISWLAINLLCPSKEPGKDNTGDRDSSPSLEEVKLVRIKFSFCKYKETYTIPIIL